MRQDENSRKPRRELSETPNVTKPVWQNPEMNCTECHYNDQDIDTFPCAKCHTRH